MAPAAPSQAHAPLPETLRALMREHAITYRALAARTQLIDRPGNGFSYSHIANLASGRDTPSRYALELLAHAFELPVSYFAEPPPRTASPSCAASSTNARSGSQPPTALTRRSAAAGRCAPPDRSPRLGSRSRGLRVAGLVVLQRAVHRRARNAEQRRQLAARVLAGLVQTREHRFLLGGELWLLAPQPALSAGDLHPLASAHP